MSNSNHAEGYRSGLSGLFDTRRKLPLGTFLGKMQELHNEIRQRVKQLERGVLSEPAADDNTSRMIETFSWQRIACINGWTERPILPKMISEATFYVIWTECNT